MSDFPLFNKVIWRAAEKLPIQKHARTNRTPVLTITFDDVPHSACVEGRAILEQFGAYGTYFICGGLTGQRGDSYEYHSGQDLEDLAGAGHELGSHTFSHKICWGANTRLMESELNQNAAFIRERLGGYAFHSFAYPHNFYGIRSKMIAARHFTCARAGRGRIITTQMDAACLPAYRMQDAFTSEEEMRDLVRKTAQLSGWSILYTHDVSDKPSRYGCSPRLMTAVLEEAARCGVAVKTMAEAYKSAILTERAAPAA